MMTISTGRKAEKFNPIKLEIDINSELELRILASLFNVATNDVYRGAIATTFEIERSRSNDKTISTNVIELYKAVTRYLKIEQ